MMSVIVVMKRARYTLSVDSFSTVVKLANNEGCLWGHQAIYIIINEVAPAFNRGLRSTAFCHLERRLLILLPHPPDH